MATNAGHYRLTLARMAVADAVRRPWRLGLLAAGIAVAGAATFGALTFQTAIGRSLERSLLRLGADALIVPAEVVANLTPAILTAEPSSATLPPETVARIAALPVVERWASQRTLQLPDAGGHLPIDVVVFDPATDFTVQPWIVESLDRPLACGDVIIGGRRPERVGERLSMQGVDLVVHGRLGLTGVGPFERSMFVTGDTGDRLAEAGIVDAAGAALPRHANATPSGILVRLAVGRGPDDLRFALAKIPGIGVSTGNGSQIDVRQAVATLARSSLAMLLVCLLAPAVLVGVAYTGMLAERRRELGLMLSIGLRRVDIVMVVTVEAAVAAVTGGLVGIVIAAALLAAFIRTVGFFLARREIPFVAPTLSECLWFGLMSLLLVTAAAVVAAAVAAAIAARREAWALVRGEGS
jgi:putative ABC transport system permease protein